MTEFDDNMLEERLAKLVPESPPPALQDRVLKAVAKSAAPRPLIRFPSQFVLAATLLILLGGSWLMKFSGQQNHEPEPLQPLCASRHIVDRSPGEFKYVEGLGLIKTIHYKIINQTVWASDDGNQVLANNTPENHTVIVALNYQ